MKHRADDARYFSPVWRFFAHVVSTYPLARVTLLLTFALLVLEYASLSLMIPLSAGANGASSNTGITAAWSSIARMLSLEPGLMNWIWLFLVVLALRSLAGYVHLCLTTKLAKQVHRELSKSVFERIVFDEPMSEIYRRTVGFYISLAGDDTFRAGTLIKSALQVLAALVSVGAGLVLLLLFSVTAFQVTMAFLVLSAIGVAFCAKTLLSLDGRAVALSRDARTSFLEALNSLRSIRSMSSEAYVHKIYTGQMTRYTRLLFLVEVLKNGIRFLPGIVALSIGILVLAPWRTDALTFEASTVFAATTILIRVFLSLGALMTAGGALLIDSRAAKDLGALIDIQRSTRVASLSTPAEQQRRALDADRVDLAGINYGYEKNRQVLHDLALSLRRGRCYSIVGPSGTGKSTLADILLGLVTPSSGTISINGHDVRAVDLRNRVILVEQQPRIFSASVRDNLNLGLESSEADVAEALDAVEMTVTVGKLPQGLDTMLDYQGANLSGGQRQRLAIARALLRKPEILILDEATSALDGATEQIVVRRVKESMRNGILIIITHDPELAAAADEIIDLQATDKRRTREASHT
jgi:ATP-binding cassette subfamily B protein